MHSFFAAFDVIHLVGVSIWPFVVLLILLVLLRTKAGTSFLNGISTRLTHVKGFGIELEMTSAVASKARGDLEGIFGDYRSLIQQEFDRLARVYYIDDLIRVFIENHVVAYLNVDAKETYRCTIHVQDVLFQEAMYQLVDYYPRGSGRGRTFSTRFGMVGMAWRTRKSQIQGYVNPDPGDLIRNWGMTGPEAAAAGQGRKSFACIILRSDNLEVGVLYLDAVAKHAFGKDAAAENVFSAWLEAQAQAVGLSSALREVCKEIRERGPLLSIFDLR